MKQQQIIQELTQIKQFLRHFSEGVSIDDIKEAIGQETELRTLQRRLKQLQESGEIFVLGHTRSTRYYLAEEASNRVGEPEHPTYAKGSLELSKESKSIQQQLTRQHRQAVGYNRTFLESYRPNIDSYLSSAEQRQLATMGGTGRSEQSAGTYAKEILQRLLIDLSWNSSRLEGNTYTLLDTQRLIAYGEAADHKSQLDMQMILNHKEAIEFIVQGEGVGFNRYTILGIHALLSDNLLPDSAASGRLRSYGVGISRSVYTPLAIPQQIEELFEILLQKTAAINDPFEQSFFMMVHLPYLQPFDDVNKRVSRLAANISLNAHNLAPLSFVDMPHDVYIQGMLGVYEQNRTALLKDVFLWAYERSCIRYAASRQTLGEPDSFRLKYRDEIRGLIAKIIADLLAPKEAGILIEKSAASLPVTDRARFIETIDTELLSLHDGNFARYRIRPAEFEQWKMRWNK